MIPEIKMYVSPKLRKVLRSHDIDPQTYQPAYSGRSVGLDLYNAGPTIIVPPGVMNYKKDQIFQDEEPSESIIDQQFRNIFHRLIPTGLRISLPIGWAGIIKERGSIIKHPLKIRAGVIDPDYTGEVFVNCVNLSAHPWEIDHGTKLPFQLVVLQANTNFTPVSLDDYEVHTKDSTRKEGMIGSSDK